MGQGALHSSRSSTCTTIRSVTLGCRPSRALCPRGLDHSVSWHPTALFPCLETLHMHSPDFEHLFDVHVQVF